jgi:hypothetical protein
MKKWILMLALMASFSASAGSLRVDDGRVLINKGDSVDTLLTYLGAPRVQSKKVICMDRRPKKNHCKEWGTAETWSYRHDDLNWKIQIVGDTIKDIGWSRY